MRTDARCFAHSFSDQNFMWLGFEKFYAILIKFKTLKKMAKVVKKWPNILKNGLKQL